MGKGNIYCGNYLQEILRRLAIVIWIEEEGLCTVLVFCPDESPVRREDKIVSPPRNKLLYLSDSERSFLCIFFPKESPFYCLQRFWTRCAKCSRCKLVAAMHRKCYWQECRQGRQCGNWTRCKLGKTTYYKIHYQYNTIKCNIIQCYRDNLGAAASGCFDSRCAIWNIGPGKTSAVNNRSVIWRRNQI